MNYRKKIFKIIEKEIEKKIVDYRKRNEEDMDKNINKKTDDLHFHEILQQVK